MIEAVSCALCKSLATILLIPRRTKRQAADRAWARPTGVSGTSRCPLMTLATMSSVSPCRSKMQSKSAAGSLITPPSRTRRCCPVRATFERAALRCPFAPSILAQRRGLPPEGGYPACGNRSPPRFHADACQGDTALACMLPAMPRPLCRGGLLCRPVPRNRRSAAVVGLAGQRSGPPKFPPNVSCR